MSSTANVKSLGDDLTAFILLLFQFNCAIDRSTLHRVLILMMLFLDFFTLGLTAAIYIKSATSSPLQPGSLKATAANHYPLANHGNVRAHDPSLIRHGGSVYMFKGGPGIEYFTAPHINGSWTKVGHVLDGIGGRAGISMINKGRRERPWAPTIFRHDGTFYCFYSVTDKGTRNSAIGVATSKTMARHSWTDHPALINTGTGHLSHIAPYSQSNAIDPSVFKDPLDNQVYLNFGSYWTNIWQVPLTDDLLQVKNPTHAAKHLSFVPLEGKPILDSYPIKTDPQGRRPEEGSYMSFKDGWYYLWFSRGECCKAPRDLTAPGTEYVFPYLLILYLTIRVTNICTNVSGTRLKWDVRDMPAVHIMI